MSSDDSRTPPNDTPQPDELPPSVSFERYDLTGHSIRLWTVTVRDKFVAVLRRLFHVGAKTQLPGAEKPVIETVKETPAKLVEYAEAQLEQTPIENQLKSAQTETEFLKQELLRKQIAQTAAVTRGQHLENAAREVELQNRIREIAKGKTGIHLVESESQISVVFGNLPQGIEFGDSAEDGSAKAN